MAPRALWTGQLRLSLVTIPIRLYPATNTERRIELHQIHEPSGKRVSYQKVAPGVGVAENENITKGLELSGNKKVPPGVAGNKELAPGARVADNENITKGFEYNKSKYVLLEQR